ncbi:hypothetical protein AB0442_25425 [Kitasatospora sp. NPDC085895]|uniref:hypothetical protein n=1 Tax=Kitasatospora sp. NPDC085895 TaxID=3155057 RepID=UPI00344B21A9
MTATDRTTGLPDGRNRQRRTLRAALALVPAGLVCSLYLAAQRVGHRAVAACAPDPGIPVTARVVGLAGLLAGAAALALCHRLVAAGKLPKAARSRGAAIGLRILLGLAAVCVAVEVVQLHLAAPHFLSRPPLGPCDLP